MQYTLMSYLRATKFAARSHHTARLSVATSVIFPLPSRIPPIDSAFPKLITILSSFPALVSPPVVAASLYPIVQAAITFPAAILIAVQELTSTLPNFRSIFTWHDL